MAPFAADIGRERGQLLIIENGKARHFHIPFLAFYGHGSPYAVEDNAAKSFDGAIYPFGIYKGRGQPFLAKAMGLVAGAAACDVEFFAFFRTGLFPSR